MTKKSEFQEVNSELQEKKFEFISLNSEFFFSELPKKSELWVINELQDIFLFILKQKRASIDVVKN